MLLVSLPVEVRDTLVPSTLTIAGIVPIFTSTVLLSFDIWLTVLNIFVPVTVLLFRPVIVSVCALPSISVPVIVKVADVLSLVLEILMNEFNPVFACEANAPFIIKLLFIAVDWVTARPSSSAWTAFTPFKTKEVEPVPDCEDEIASWSNSEVPLNLALILLSSGPSIITSPFFIKPSYCWPSKDNPIVVPSGGRDVIISPLIWETGVPILNSLTSAFEIS